MSYLYVNVLAGHFVLALVDGLVVLGGIDEKDFGCRDVQVRQVDFLVHATLVLEFL
jgi:hypothetical protein